jgi:uncharacterized protein with ParB-like and HNH nuclease domain
MDTKAYSVSQIFDPAVRFVVPRFQRGYVWTQQDQWEPLWEEMEEMAIEELEGRSRTSDYYLGAVVVRPLRKVDGVPDKEVIDGQQRLTTLQILLKAIHDAASKFEAAHVVKFLRGYFFDERYANPRYKYEERFKIWPTDADRDVFREIMEAGGRSDIDKAYPQSKRGRHRVNRPRLAEAYLFFSESVESYAGLGDPNTSINAFASDARLEKLLAVVQKRLKIVMIDLDEKDDPLVIFESLNGRMTPLLASDLIKNFAIRSSGDEGDQLYDEYWKSFDATENGQENFWRGKRTTGRREVPRLDQFVMNYLQYYRGSELKIPDLFREFRFWWEAESAKSRAPKALFRELIEYAGAFRKMIEPQQGLDAESIFFSNLMLMDVSLLYPLLLFLLKWARDSERLLEDDLPGMLQDLESYMVRRHVCDLTKKKYNYVFPKVLKALRGILLQKQQIDRLDLRKVLLEFSGDSVDWPNDDLFHRGWMETPLYDSPPHGFVTIILGRIDRKLRRHVEPLVISYREMTIEHIIPQEWREHWPLPPDATGSSYRGKPETPAEHRDRLLHTIGNLTLLATQTNSSNGNRAYKYKQEVLLDQNSVRLNAYFRSIPDWNEAEIQKRSEELFKVALELWPYPSHENELRNASQSLPVGSIARSPMPASVTSPTPTAGAKPASAFEKQMLAPIEVHSDAVVLLNIEPNHLADAQHDIRTASSPIADFAIPFRPTSSYWAIVKALILLGIDQSHTDDSIVNAVRREMGVSWDDFEKKPGMTADKRIIQNVGVLNRDEESYGGKLRKIGFQIRKDNGKWGLFTIPKQA